MDDQDSENRERSRKDMTTSRKIEKREQKHRVRNAGADRPLKGAEKS